MRQKFTPAEVTGQLIRVPGDGNCLFTAIAIALAHNRRLELPSSSDLRALGATCRRLFLKRLEEAVQGGETLEGLPLINAIVGVGTPPTEPGAPGTAQLRPAETAGSRPAAAADSSTTAGFLEYLRRMTVAQDSQTTPEQWGGFPEARAAAQIWNVSMFIVGHLGGNQYQLYMAPVLQADPAHTCCLVYSGGNHFDALLASATDFHQRLGGPDQ